MAAVAPRLKAAFRDWRRRRLLARAGIGVELHVPTFAAGARSGVWSVVPDGLDADSVVYSFGVGDNVAWDLAMIERFGCAVHAFDPTPGAAAWLADQRLPERFVHRAVGLAAHDGVQAFAAPRRGRGVDYRPLPAARPGAIELPVRRLPTLARQLGHERIDVLKMDIEGGEYAALPDVLAAGPPARQLLIEFHHHPGRGGTAPFAATERAIAALRAAGYRIFAVSRRGLEFGFLRAGA